MTATEFAEAFVESEHQQVTVLGDRSERTVEDRVDFPPCSHPTKREVAPPQLVDRKTKRVASQRVVYEVVGCDVISSASS